MKELKNMLIVDVTECSDHAKTRIGRVIELIAMQEPDTAIMWYPECGDGLKRRFRLSGVTVKKKLFSKTVILRTATGIYTLRPATRDEMEHARKYAEYRSVVDMVTSAYGGRCLLYVTGRSSGIGKKPERRELCCIMSTSSDSMSYQDQTKAICERKNFSQAAKAY